MRQLALAFDAPIWSDASLEAVLYGTMGLLREVSCLRVFVRIECVCLQTT